MRLRDVKLPLRFKESIEAKLTAEQRVAQKQFELEQARKEAVGGPPSVRSRARCARGRPARGREKLKVSARIQIEPIGLDHRVEGKIALS